MVFFSNRVSAVLDQDIERGQLNVEPVRPKRPKKGTDQLVTLAFFGALAAIILLSYFGLTKGRPEIFIFGVDSWGNVCGRNKNILHPKMQTYLMDHSGHKFEFHFKSTNSSHNLLLSSFLKREFEDIVFCVEECPRTLLSCEEFVRDSGYDFNSTRMSKRMCSNNSSMVTPQESIYTKCFSEGQAQNKSVDPILRILDAVESYKQDVLYLSCIAVIFSIGYFLMFEIITSIMVGLSCLLAGVGSFGLLIYFWSRFVFLQTMNLDLNVEPKIRKMQITLLGSSDDTIIFLGYSAFMTLFILLIFLCVKLVWYQKKKTLGILNESSCMTCRLPSTTLQPLFRLAISFSLTAAVVYIGLHFLFLQEPVVDSDGVMGYVEKSQPYSFGFIIALVLAFFYVGEVFLGCQRVVLAGIFSRWYFVSNEKKVAKEKGLHKGHPFDELSFVYPLGYLLRYNFGSVCLASFLIPPFQIGRLTFTLIYRKIRKRKSRKVHFSSADRWGGSCCWWTRRCLQYISYYNYICIAMYGLSFWKSGKKSASLLTKVSHILGTKIRADIVLFFAKMSVVFFTAFVGLMYFKTKYHFAISANVLIAVTASCVFAYFIASCFFSMQEVALDTIILSFCDDMKRNNGQNRPYFARKQLRTIMAKPRYRREGWTKKTVKIPICDINDSRLRIPASKIPVYDPRLTRPKAARGKRRSPDEVRNESPKRAISNDTISMDGSVQMLVDRFDMFVDKMMIEREKSPLSKRRNSEIYEKPGASILPPINPSRELPATSVFTGNALQDQLLLLDVSDSDSTASKAETSKAPIPKPILLSLPEVRSQMSINDSPKNVQCSTSTINAQDLPGSFFDDETNSATTSSTEKAKTVSTNDVKVDSKNNPAEPYVPTGQDFIKFYSDVLARLNS